MDRQQTYDEFSFWQGTYEFKGSNAILAALLTKIVPLERVATLAENSMRVPALGHPPLPPLDPITTEGWREKTGEWQVKHGEPHYRSKMAAEQIIARYPDYVRRVQEAFDAAHDAQSQMANTMAGNRDQAHV